jgi:hypothetical protein
MLSTFILKVNIIFFSHQSVYVIIERFVTGQNGKYLIVPAYTIGYRKLFRECERKIYIQLVFIVREDEEN